MLKIDIPGSSALALNHLVLDYNGTIAEDGELIHGVEQRLVRLSDVLTVHIITANTHGTVLKKVHHLPVQTSVIGDIRQDEQKKEYVNRLKASSVVAMGNGRNDCRMLQTAALGVALLQMEGCAAGVLTSADVVSRDINEALDLLLVPDRLRATLRN